MKLSNETIATITQSVQTELLKRGFTARISMEQKESRDGNAFLEITSESFQTVPVIMESIKIEGSFFVATEDDVYNVAGRVGVKYTHFSGGSNGTELFLWSCTTRNDEIFGIRTS